MRLDYPRQGKTGLRRFVPSWRQLLALSGLGIVLAVGAFVLLYVTIDVPKPNDQALQQSTVIYYADGKNELGRLGSANRTSIPISQMPIDTRHSVLAAEDRQFYEHGGVSITGIGRAFWNNVMGGSQQGGSTITQQLVKNYYLTQDRTITRKVNEFIVSVKIEQQLSKDQILEDYLNTIYFGRGAYGLEAAAKAYFGVPAAKLTTAQGAVLASIIRSPGGYSPENHLDKLQGRWNSTLDAQVAQGWLTPAKRSALVFPKILVRRPATRTGGPAGYLVAYVKSELDRQGFTGDDLAYQGLKVVTTFDKKAEAAAVTAVSHQRPTLNAKGVRMGLASVNPQNGAIVAMYGGADYGNPQYLNDATQSIAQAGSTFKPFTLIAALESGITLDSQWDGHSPRTFAKPDGSGTYTVPNFGGESFGRISLARATANSVNTVFVDVENQPQVGPAKVIDAARRAGVPSDVVIEDNLTATLGTASPTALDMASAYATLAAGGLHTTPTSIAKVYGSNGGVLYELHATPVRTIDQDIVANVDIALQQVVTQGSGFRAQALGRPAAGKTGTTNNNVSAWFVGYTPQLATAVNMFKPTPDGASNLSMRGVGSSDPNHAVTGGGFPAAVWTAYMKDALKDQKVLPFPTPTVTASASPSATATQSLTPSATPTPTPTPTVTSSPSPSISPSGSPSGSPSPSPSVPVPPVAPAATSAAGAATSRAGAAVNGILAPGGSRSGAAP